MFYLHLCKISFNRESDHWYDIFLFQSAVNFKLSSFLFELYWTGNMPVLTYIFMRTLYCTHSPTACPLHLGTGDGHDGPPKMNEWVNEGLKGLRGNEEAAEEGVEAVKKGNESETTQKEHKREDQPPPSVVLLSCHVNDTAYVIEPWPEESYSTISPPLISTINVSRLCCDCCGLVSSWQKHEDPSRERHFRA